MFSRVCYGFCKPTFMHVCILWLSTRFVKYVYLWIFTCWSINELKLNEHSIFAEINHRLSIHNLRCVKWLYCSLFCASWAIYVFFPSLMSGHSRNINCYSSCWSVPKSLHWCNLTKYSFYIFDKIKFLWLVGPSFCFFLV